MRAKGKIEISVDNIKKYEGINKTLPNFAYQIAWLLKKDTGYTTRSIKSIQSMKSMPFKPIYGREINLQIVEVDNIENPYVTLKGGGLLKYKNNTGGSRKLIKNRILEVKREEILKVKN